MDVSEPGWSIERLCQLREEYSNAQAQLRELDRVRLELRDTLLRISGAISVLEELVEASAVFREAADGNAASVGS
jgi:hypothetical protein